MVLLEDDLALQPGFADFVCREAEALFGDCQSLGGGARRREHGCSFGVPYVWKCSMDGRFTNCRATADTHIIQFARYGEVYVTPLAGARRLVARLRAFGVRGCCDQQFNDPSVMNLSVVWSREVRGVRRPWELLVRTNEGDIGRTERISDLQMRALRRRTAAAALLRRQVSPAGASSAKTPPSAEAPPSVETPPCALGAKPRTRSERKACHACIQRNSRSNHHEDQKLLPLLVGTTTVTGTGTSTTGTADGASSVVSTRRGSFVEIGALDGLAGSNTYLLEMCHGWSGVLIEANSLNFEKLRRSGRSRAKFVHSAICHGSGRVRFTKAGDDVAAQVDVMSSDYRRRWSFKQGNRSHVEEVPCRGLGPILDDVGLGWAALRPTFLSLDVEGAEELVLQTVEPARFDVVLVEWGPESEKNARVHRLLTAGGLQFHDEWDLGPVVYGGRNRVYVKPEQG